MVKEYTLKFKVFNLKIAGGSIFFNSEIFDNKKLGYLLRKLPLYKKRFTKLTTSQKLFGILTFS